MRIKLLISFLSTYWPLYAKLLKNSYSRSRAMMHHFWNQNYTFTQTTKPINMPCSFHLCLSTYQKSKSDIILLMKFWWLKNTEIPLTESHFWLQLKNQVFPRHAVFAECQWTIKTFVLHQFPDKTKEVIFLKSPKTLFLGHFWLFCCHFCPSGIFSKNHNIIWAPNTMLSFRKN